ncbi:hypothetical protein, partial [Desulfovibrio sp. 1214_IL3152]
PALAFLPSGVSSLSAAASNLSADLPDGSGADAWGKPSRRRCEPGRACSCFLQALHILSCSRSVTSARHRLRAMPAAGRIDLAAVHRHYQPLPKGLFLRNFVLKLFREVAPATARTKTRPMAQVSLSRCRALWATFFSSEWSSSGRLTG